MRVTQSRMHEWPKITLSLLRNKRVMNNWQVGQTLLNHDANSRGMLLHLNVFSINLGIITVHLMVCFEGRKDEHLSVEGDRICMGGRLVHRQCW